LTALVFYYLNLTDMSMPII